MKRHLTSILIAAALWAAAGSANAHTYPTPSGTKVFGHCAKGPCMKRTDWSAGQVAKIGKHGAKASSDARRERARHTYIVARN